MPSSVHHEAIRVLLVEDDPERVRAIQRMLPRATTPGMNGFALARVSTLAAALELLGRKEHPFHAVILDLEVPDSHRLVGLPPLIASAHYVPVVALTVQKDARTAVEAVRQGAQECLAWPHLLESNLESNGQEAADPGNPSPQEHDSLLARALRHAIYRKGVEGELTRRIRESVAEQNRMEEQAAQWQARTEQLGQINRNLDEFTSMVSHDLQEPLRGISAYCGLLLEDYRDRLEDAGRRRLDAVAAMCDRLSQTVDHLLTHCRVGQTPNDRRIVHFGVVVGHAIETLGPIIETRRALIRVLGPLPSVVADPMLLAMVLGNLVSNALKFNENRQPCVEIGWANPPARHGEDTACLPMESSMAGPSANRCSPYVPVFFVRDNGIGIAKEHHKSIFAMFHRLHSRRKYEGTGLGLAIVRKIIEAHGGRVWVESEPSRGSTFFFTLALTGQEPEPKSRLDSPHRSHFTPETAQPDPTFGEHPASTG